VLAAAGAAKFTGMRAARCPDAADVLAARPLAIDGAVELHLQADQRRVAEQVHDDTSFTSSTRTQR
jgi:hypothetical protein